MTGGLLRGSHHIQVAVLTVACFSALVGVSQILPWPVTDWRAVVVTFGIVALGAYGLHRYERVSLGLVTEDDP